MRYSGDDSMDMCNNLVDVRIKSIIARNNSFERKQTINDNNKYIIIQLMPASNQLLLAMIQ